MIEGLEITDRGRKFIERYSSKRAAENTDKDFAENEEVALLKAMDSAEELASSDGTPLTINNLTPIALYAAIRVVRKEYAVRTDE